MMKKIECINCGKIVSYERECVEGLGYCCIPCAIENLLKRIKKLEKNENQM